MFTHDFLKSALSRRQAVKTQCPSEAQIAYGNYEKLHICCHGLRISIENPRGSTRSGVDKSGRAWSRTMPFDYGYARETVSGDGDKLDFFLGPKYRSATSVHIIDQIDPSTGKFDEHKVMLGWDTQDEARKAYLSNYERGWRGLGDVVTLSMPAFKDWIYDDKRTKKPVSAIVKSAKVNHTFITGIPGSGKTTLAEKMNRETGLPVIHVDKLPATDFYGKPTFAGSDELRSHLKTLTTPHIIEGAQIMGLKPVEVSGKVILLDPDNEVLAKRLMDRGWTEENKSTGAWKEMRGPEASKEAEMLIAEFREYLNNFHKRMDRGGRTVEKRSSYSVVKSAMDIGRVFRLAKTGIKHTNIDPKVAMDAIRSPGLMKMIKAIRAQPKLTYGMRKIFPQEVQTALSGGWQPKRGLSLATVGEKPSWFNRSAAGKLYIAEAGDNTDAIMRLRPKIKVRR